MMNLHCQLLNYINNYTRDPDFNSIPAIMPSAQIFAHTSTAQLSRTTYHTDHFIRIRMKANKFAIEFWLLEQK